jgi:methylmalonyl-CoA mutase N-terminal domain/subunit
MIINKELGLNFNENPWQGSFIVDRLTDMVEEAVYRSSSASERGGVLGAMDTMYQRGKIQEESLYYEHKKHDGSLPLVGVNTFRPCRGRRTGRRRNRTGPFDRRRKAAAGRQRARLPEAQCQGIASCGAPATCRMWPAGAATPSRR